MNKQGLYQNKNTDVRENVVAGIVGAFLFSLAGGILWFVIYLFGFIAGISGLVGAVCAIKGYSIFAKKESMKGIVISVIISLLVIAAAWYMCFAYDIYTFYNDMYALGEIDYTLTFSESASAVPYFLSEPDIGPAYIKDLLIGLVLCIVGGGSYVVNKMKGLKNAKNNATFAPAAEAEAPVSTEEEAAPVNEFAVPANEEAPEAAEEAPAEEKQEAAAEEKAE